MKAIVWFKYTQLIFNKYLDKSPEDHVFALFYMKGLWVIAKQNNFVENYPVTFNRLNAFLAECNSVNDDDIRTPFSKDPILVERFIGHLKGLFDLTY